MGVTNGPPAYQSIMQQLFASVLFTCLAIFIDDCAVYSRCVVRWALRVVTRIQPELLEDEELQGLLKQADTCEPHQLPDGYGQGPEEIVKRVQDGRVPRVVAGRKTWVFLTTMCFLHLFSGDGGFPQVWTEYRDLAGQGPWESVTVLSIDLLWGFALLDNETYEALLWGARAGRFLAIHGGFPCETYCPLRRVGEGPRALRSRELPGGLPEHVLAPKDRLQLQRANELSGRGLDVMETAQCHGGGWMGGMWGLLPLSVENPADLGHGPSFFHHYATRLKKLARSCGGGGSLCV